MLYTIHGWGFSKEIWKHAGLSKAQHIELPGHGSSKYTQTDILSLSEEIAKTVPKKSTVIGWSVGATLACLIATRTQVENLILISPTLKFLNLSQPETAIKKFLRDLKRDFRDTVLWFRKLCFNEKEIDLDFNLPDKEPSIKLLESFCYFDLTPYLRLIRSRVKIVAGENDQITKIEGAFKTFELIGNCELTVKRKGDHFPLNQKDLEFLLA